MKTVKSKNKVSENRDHLLFMIHADIFIISSRKAQLSTVHPDAHACNLLDEIPQWVMIYKHVS